MGEIFNVAAGVLIAFFIMRVVDWILEAPQRVAVERQKRQHFEKFLDTVGGDIIRHLENAEIAKNGTVKKKRATQKPAVKKTVTTKKGK